MRWEKKERLPLKLLFLLSLIFLRHNKDGGDNSTNINKQPSPAQNTPVLQANDSTQTIPLALKTKEATDYLGQ